ncbi:MAG: phosphoribosylformylglycinamidine cyclo-ligase [Dehalococcoidia bacterium]
MGWETNNNRETYAAAGVDLDAAGKALEFVKRKAHATFRPEVLTGIGAFAGLFQLSGYKDPVLVSSVDGVGTKIKIAIALDRHDTIGLDLVNHCVNDISTCGAEPLFFLDYIAMGKLVPEQVESIVDSLSRACRDVGCALIGGETAEMPGLYAPGDYDLVGFIVGAVEREKLLQNTSIEAGDAILALPSSGLHTNGYSLVRRVLHLSENAPAALEVFYPELGRTLGEELLEPHRCYYNLLRPALCSEGGQGIKGLAHITGGGLIDNVARILPQGLAAHFGSGTWPVPPIFDLIQKRGDIEDREMYRVFNMGIGMVLICPSSYVDGIIAAVPEVRPVGEVAKGEGEERVIVS